MTDTASPLPDELVTRIRAADRLLRALLDEVGADGDPAFTAEQSDLIERRVYEIRSALAGEPQAD